MSDIQALLKAYNEVKRCGQSAALATVVNANGSTYRRPGARMLVTGSGQTVGMISGGCLEHDVMEHAKQVMQSGKPRLITYDTTADEAIVWGLGLGCNGIVQILIEPLAVACAFNPLTLLAECFEWQQHAVLATVFTVEGVVNLKSGERLLYHPHGTVSHNIDDPNFVLALLPNVQAVFATQRYTVKSYAWSMGRVSVLLEWLAPPPSIVIFGAGQDAVPVAQLAKTLGWQVTIVDCRSSALTQTRFPMADQVLLTRRDTVHEQIQITTTTIAVVMTHHYLDDAALLNLLLSSPAQYIGILGPKHRTERLLRTLQQEDAIKINQAWERLHAPTGLDLGAETPEAIALSIVAEIQAVLTQHPGGFLKHRQGAIHRRQKTSSHEALLCLR